jgi:hypothetical protein
MRGYAFGAIVVALAVSQTCAGQIKGPAEVTVPIGRLASIPLTVDGDDVEYTILGGDIFGGFREFSDAKTFRFQVLGYTPGTGYVVIGAVKDGKLQPLFTVVVKVTGPAPVPPGPIPPPIPPPDPPAPVDPLVAAIKATATPPAKLREIADAMTACVGVTSSGRTAAEGQQARKKAMADLIPGGIPNALADVLAAQLKAVDGIAPPSAPEHVIVDAERDAIRAIYSKVSKALTEAAK